MHKTYQTNSGRKPSKRSSFTPLKDLLTKNHDDRVKDYLSRMEGLTMEEVVHSQSIKANPVQKSPVPRKSGLDESYGNAK